jgi:hypothetical protein
VRKVVLASLLTIAVAVPIGAQTKSKVRLGLFSAVLTFGDLEGNWQTFERMEALRLLSWRLRR